MVKAHSPINWENEPSFNTPINETNLNKMDSTIGVLDDRIIEQETSKLDKSTAYTMVKDISFNENNGVFTVTRLNGSTFTIDTKLEKVSINFDYNAETQQIEIILIDGTKQYIDISSLISPIDFVDSDTIGWEVTTDGKVKAKVLDGSITEDMLQPNYLAEIKVETEKSAQSMANAKISENNAKQSELNAKASEEQALEYSNNAQPLAQSVSGNNPTATNSTNASLIYLNNKGYTQQDGTPSPDAPIHIGASADKGYFDGVLLQGAYKIADGSYDSNYKYIVSSKNKMLCNSGDNIIVSYEEAVTNLHVLFYNDNGFITNVEKLNTSTISTTAPENATYFHIRIDKPTTETLTPSTAKHICVTINGMYAVRVKTSIWNGVLRQGALLVADGSYDSSRQNIVCSKNGIYCKEKDTIELKYSEVAYGLYIFYYGDNGFISCDTTTYSNVLTSVVPSRATYCHIRIDKASGEILTPSTAKKISITINGNGETEALIPVSAPLYEGDYIEVYADGSGCEYRKMGSVVFDGSDDELFTITGSGDNARFNFNLSEIGLAKAPTNQNTKPNVVCNALLPVSMQYIYNNGYGVALYSQKTLVIRMEGITTLDELRAQLQSNSIHVVYELATPTSTPLTAEQVAEFMKLQTFKGVTHVTADGEVVVRYYCNNASGETVSMLQGMVEETKEAVSKVENLGNAFEVFDVTSASISVSSGQTNTIMLPLSADGYTALGIVGASSDTDGVDIGGVTMDIDRVTAYVKVTNHTSASKSAKVTIQVLYIK